MNFADIQKTWQSPHNRPDAAELDQMKQIFIAEHNRRRRGQKWLVYNAGAVLTLVTLRFAVFAIWPAADQDGFDPVREWGALLLLLLPWSGLILLARRLARHDREHGRSEQTIAASVRALLDENRLSRTRVKVVAVLHGVLLLLLPLVVYQLRAAGKAGDEIMVPAFVIWPLIATGIFLALWWHDRRKLRPRQHELEVLLQSYE